MPNSQMTYADRLRFSLVRTATRLQAMPSENARQLATHILAQLKEFPSEAETFGEQRGDGHAFALEGRMFRATPGLAAYMVTALWLNELTDEVFTALDADPELADLRSFLEQGPPQRNLR